MDDTMLVKGMMNIHNNYPVLDELLKMLWDKNHLNMRRLNELGAFLISIESNDSLAFCRGIQPYLLNK